MRQPRAPAITVTGSGSGVRVSARPRPDSTVRHCSPPFLSAVVVTNGSDVDPFPFLGVQGLRSGTLILAFPVATVIQGETRPPSHFKCAHVHHLPRLQGSGRDPW